MIDGIPPEWLRKPFGELCSQRREMLHNLSGNQDRYVGLEHLDSGIARVRRWGQADDLRSSKFRFQRGDVLYGKLRPYLDKSALAEWDGICSTEIVPFTPKVGIAEPAFLSYLVHCSEFVSYAVAHTTGVNHPRASLTDVERYEVAVPPLPEQRAIAAVLTKLQQAVELQEKTVATLKELKTATMAKLFREGLHGERLKKTEIGEIPESWEAQPIRFLKKKMNYGCSKQCSLEPNGLPVIRIPNVINEDIDTTELKYLNATHSEIASFGLIRGDLLFVRTNGSKDYLGRCAVYQELPPNALFASYLIRVTFAENIVPEYAQAYLSSSIGREQIISKAIPASDGKFNINSQVLDDALLPIPARREEQEEIWTIISRINDQLRLAVKSVQVRRALFASSLHQLMTGQIRVTGIMDAEGNLTVGGGG